MKKIYFIIFLSFILLFTGCSQNSSFFSSNDKTGKAQEDNTGNGLEVNFRISNNNILSKKINYEINLKNSGKEDITLTKENINLNTIQKLNDNSQIFTKESLDTFYSKLLGDSGSLTLVQNQEKNNIGGYLIIKEEYFNKITNEKIDYSLNINYDYKTKFSNNIELNTLENAKTKLRILDSLSQAAPVKIKNIKIENSNEESQYFILFEIIEDSSFSSDTKVKFNNFNFDFKSESLNDCKFYIKENNLNKRIENIQTFVLNKNNKELIVRCLIKIDDKEKINTQVSGEINYNYEIKKIGSISLPNNRLEEDIWN